MSKKNIFIGLGLILVCVIGYNLLSSEPGAGTETEGNSGFGGALRKAVSKVLPGKSNETNPDDYRPTDDPHVVVIKRDKRQAPEEVIETIEGLQDSKATDENEQLDYARWAIFSESYTKEEREKFFEKALESLNESDAHMLARDMIFTDRAPEFYEKALNFVSKDMNQKQLESLIRELLPQTTNPQLKTQLTEFAASRNIYIR